MKGLKKKEIIDKYFDKHQGSENYILRFEMRKLIDKDVIDSLSRSGLYHLLHGAIDVMEHEVRAEGKKINQDYYGEQKGEK